MSKRLSSFGGPSAPSPPPVTTQSKEPAPSKPKIGSKGKNKGRDVTPSSPSFGQRDPKSPFSKAIPSGPFLGSGSSVHARSLSKTKSPKITETYLQIYTRATLKRTAANLEGWDTLASRRAIICARALVDKVTELDNTLSVLPEGVQPHSRILGPRLKELDSKREELRGCLVELDVLFTQVAGRSNALEIALTKLTERDPVESIQHQTVWTETSWPFPRYVTGIVSHVAKVTRQLNRTRYTLSAIADQIVAYSLCSPDTNISKSDSKSTSPTFAEARTAIASWSSETSHMAECIKDWLEACAIEVPAWDEIEVESGESENELDLVEP